MNICFVAHLPDLSGANRSLIDLVLALKEEGQNITVIVPRNGELRNKLNTLGIKNKCILSTSWVGYEKGEKRIKKISKKFINYFAEYRMYIYFKKNKDIIDIVHYNSFIYGVGAKSLNKLNIPYVWHIREFPEETFKLKFYNKKYAYEIVSKSKKIFAISKSIYDRFSKDFGADKMQLIYNGLNLKDCIDKKIDEKKNTEILIVGAIARDKGQLEAIKAIDYIINKKQLLNIKLNIVGNVIDKDYMNELERYIRKKNIDKNIIFHGYSDNVNIYRNKCDIALMCSKMEAFGRVTVEAMLSKQLVIGANTGGTTEIINHMKTGILYEQGNIADLANKIEYAMNNKKEIDEIRERGRIIAIDKFSIKRTAEEVIKQYCEIKSKFTYNL